MPEKRSDKKQGKWPLQSKRVEKVSAAEKGRGFSVPEVPRDAAGLDRRIELYELQLKNLRSELEQIKLQSIIHNLNASEKPVDDREAILPETFDAALFENIYVKTPEQDEAEAAIEKWAKERPELGYKSPFPIPRNKSLTVKSSSEWSETESAVVYSLSLKLFHLNERIKGLEKYIYYLSSRIAAPESVERRGPENSLSYDQLAEMCVNFQDKIFALEDRLKELPALEKKCEQLKASRDELNEQVRGLYMDIDAQFDEIVAKHSESVKTEYSQRFDKQQAEIEKMGRIISALNDSVRNAKTESKKKDSFIVQLENKIEELEKPANEDDGENEATEEMREETPPGPELNEYLSALDKNQSLESILRLRSYFLKTKRYSYGVKTYIDLMDKFDGKKMLPALCVLIGELYLETGKKDEANYYLGNNLVKEDALALSLLQNIPVDRFTR